MLKADLHKQKDLFILDLADVVPKDDLMTMEKPVFSLSKRPDQRTLTYETKESKLTIQPTTEGLPTIFDKDVLIFVTSQLMAAKERGQSIGKRVAFSAREFMISTNRDTGGASYKRLLAAFQRLRGTTFTHEYELDGQPKTRVFGFVDEAGFVFKKNDKSRSGKRVDYCEVVLSDWLMEAIEHNEVLSISPDYFRLSRPLERRLYEIARKHCGKADGWKISLAKLQEKTGSNSSLKRFRFNLKQVIEADDIPFYEFQIDDRDMVNVRPRKRRIEVRPDAKLKLETIERLKEICIEKRLDYETKLDDWVRFQKANKAPTKNADGSALAYFKKAKSLA